MLCRDPVRLAGTQSLAGEKHVLQYARWAAASDNGHSDALVKTSCDSLLHPRCSIVVFWPPSYILIISAKEVMFLSAFVCLLAECRWPCILFLLFFVCFYVMSACSMCIINILLWSLQPNDYNPFADFAVSTTPSKTVIAFRGLYVRRTYERGSETLWLC